MLGVLGVGSIEELLGAFPPELRLKEGLRLPRGLSEQELAGLLERRSRKNTSVKEVISFLGAGAYHHYIPSVVEHLLSRSEFYTSYTPYQPEISQGTLQAIFEYQTLICQLTSMDVANASLYDGASAVAEAVLMARRITKRSRVLLSSALHPEYRETVATYLRTTPDDIKEVPFCTETGATLPEAVEEASTGEPACLVVQHPNFFGSLENLKTLSEVIHSKGGLLIVAISEPISLGMLKPPGELGADIVVGEGQSFGNSLNFGGPYLGFMATKERFLRQMPGRLVGETVDKNGRRAFCLTLATREQHIRRHKATSNICTNQGLCALAAAVYLSALGRRGFMELARLNFSKAGYLEMGLLGIKGVVRAFSAPFFNEFVLKVPADAGTVLKKLLERGIIGGLNLKKFHPSLTSHILITVTEMNTKEDMDRFIGGFSECLR